MQNGASHRCKVAQIIAEKNVLYFLEAFKNINITVMSD